MAPNGATMTVIDTVFQHRSVIAITCNAVDDAVSFTSFDHFSDDKLPKTGP